MSQQIPGSLTGRPPSGPSTPPTFWHAWHAFHARQGKQPTGGQSSHSQQHGQEPARHTRARVPHRRRYHPLMFEAAACSNVAAMHSSKGAFWLRSPIPVTSGNLSRYHHMHGLPSYAKSQTGSADHKGTHTVAHVIASPRHTHWEAVEQSSRYSPSTSDPHFAHVEVSSPQKGHPNATAASLWTGAPYRGAHPPSSRAATPQRYTVARRHHTLTATHGGKEASCPCSPTSYTLQRPSQPCASSATTTTGPARSPKRADPPLNCHMGNTAADVPTAPSLSTKMRHFATSLGLCTK